ncbi:FAS1-like dehydratase domain-containing protein [[Mycobacterium] nativiensis]|uniref:MaoC family dehydratase N-terminal domain-containing protein n=1 Tax=[Mycobacterium] nativiensis TaxID=2855503 RepID=A0ABU5XUQ3_9MYCO|nr:MaoC family dehydratase N-terminal domain-containing protein [Mycolicibacter sp. MYC340]MEB3031221.1 MaoC family dehydratase N-terminal domain-containing protein [Mycolicibacter sp. MYC340]
MTQTEQAQDFDHAIKDEDIERAKLLLGIDAPASIDEFHRELSVDAIRNFARGYGDDNPLYVDPGYAAGTRWSGPIAPPMIHCALSRKMLGDPIPDDIRKATKGLFSGVHIFVSGQQTEWFQPVRPGDELYGFGGLESIEDKHSEFAGRSIIRIRRVVRVNQRAEVVAVERTILIGTERKKSRERGKYMDIEPATYTAEQIAEIDAIYAAEGPRGAQPRYYEDVEVGEALPKMVKGPLTLTDVISFHAGGYGFGPYGIGAARVGYKNRQRVPKFYINNAAGIPDVAQRLHWENEWSQSIGNPMAYDYGIMRECWLTHYVTDWIGDDGWLLRQHDEMRKFNYIGDTQFITGEVVAKRIENGNGVIDLEFRATSQRGEVTAPATATVALPSREFGPVVLPQPEEELRRKAVAMMERHNELARGRNR